MSEGQDLVRQPSLSPEVFNRFINLKVGLSLSGSASYDVAVLETVLAGDRLQKGSELVITARYFVADMHMPVTRQVGYDYSAGSDKKASYRLGDAKLDMKLIGIEKIDVQAAHLEQSMAARCTCLVPNLPNTKKPEGYHPAQHPLTQYWAAMKCPECRGVGYVLPKKNKAPLSDRIHPSGVIVLVDGLPEPPDVPEGACPQCGETRNYHKQNCPVKAEAEAAEKKRIADAKKRVKAETGKTAPSCFTNQWECRPFTEKCKACHALQICAETWNKDLPVTPVLGEDNKIHQCPFGDRRESRCPCDYFDDCAIAEKPKCFGAADPPDPDLCEECRFADQCDEQMGSYIHGDDAAEEGEG